MTLHDFIKKSGKSQHEVTNYLHSRLGDVPKADQELDGRFKEALSSWESSETPSGTTVELSTKIPGGKKSAAPSGPGPDETGSKRPDRAEKHSPIGIIGLPGAGKTAYLFALSKQTKQKLWGEWAIAVYDDYSAFSAKLEDELERTKKLPKTDEAAEHQVLQMFSMLRSAPDGCKEQVTITSFDCAGENWKKAFMDGINPATTDGSMVRQLRDAVRGCKGFIFLIDATTFIRMHSERDKERKNAQAEFATLADRYNRMLGSIAGLIDARERHKFDVPVAFVFTQADYFEEHDSSEGVPKFGLFEAWSKCYEDSKAESGTDSFTSLLEKHFQRTREDRRDLARKVAERCYSQLYTLFARSATNLEFFSVSNFGFDRVHEDWTGGVKDVTIATNIVPLAVTEPIEWIADKAMESDRVQRAHQRVKVWLLVAAALVILLVLSILGLVLAAGLSSSFSREGRLEQAESAITFIHWNPLFHLLDFGGMHERLGVSAAEHGVVRAYFSRGAVSLSGGSTTDAIVTLLKAKQLGAQASPPPVALIKDIDRELARAHRLSADGAAAGGLPDDEYAHLLEVAKLEGANGRNEEPNPETKVLVRRMARTRWVVADRAWRSGQSELAWKPIFQADLELPRVFRSGFATPPFRDEIVVLMTNTAAALFREERPKNHKLAFSVLDSVPQSWLSDASLSGKLQGGRSLVLADRGCSQLESGSVALGLKDLGTGADIAGTNRAEEAFLKICLDYGRVWHAAGKDRELEALVDGVEASALASAIRGKMPELAHLQTGLAKSALKRGDKAGAGRRITQALRTNPINFEALSLKTHLEVLADMQFIPTAFGGFYLDTFEVTNAEYENFLNQIAVSGDARVRHSADPAKPGKREDPKQLPLPGGESYERYSPTPDCAVVFVSWYDAYAYARFRQKRLPTAQEWEAAVGDNPFPWGNQFAAGKANTAESNYSKVSQRHEFPGDKSPLGISHLAGNVSEWTDTAESDIRGVIGRAVKGGCWVHEFRADSTDLELRSARKEVRRVYPAETRKPMIGFRCAADVIPR